MVAPESNYRLPPLSTGDIGGARFTWRATADGSGTPLVLLHGIGSNARAWSGQFPESAGFTGQRPVLAWNAPGYANSQPLSEPWPTAKDYARALTCLLDYNGYDRIILVGQSLGAIVATAFACLYPERVVGLMLASPAQGYRTVAGAQLPVSVQARIDELSNLGPHRFAEQRYSRLLTHSASPKVHEIVRQAMAEVEPLGYTAAARFLAVSDLLGDVAHLSIRPVVVWGADDVVTPPEKCLEVARAASAREAIEIPGGGHAFATEIPHGFNAVLRQMTNLSTRSSK